jgi:glycosyltransferase involved in cell wall biosynthesis
MRALKVAVCADFREEQWPSMDRVAERLTEALRQGGTPSIAPTLLRPRFRARALRLSQGRTAHNIDRGLNRLFDYPRQLRSVREQFDLFHVVDHSYAQLAHQIPPGRAVVTCHDLDTFRSLFAPDEETRSPIFKAMMQHVLAGLRRAACVTCDTAAIRDELVARNLVSSTRTVVAPIGVDGIFNRRPDGASDREAAQLVGAPPGAIELLHVGSTIPRKRIELLLGAFAQICRQAPAVRLVRVGGPFSAGQARMVRELGLEAHISVLPPIHDAVLAAVYRRAAVLLLPSAREGFGLPVVEAMACGTPVIASDLPVLREVGGPEAIYCASPEPAGWAATVVSALSDRQRRGDAWAERQARGMCWAGRFTWKAFAERVTDVYGDVAAGRYAAVDDKGATWAA